MEKLYFTQRLSIYVDQDPPLLIMLLTAPLVALQITGPLLIHAIFAAEHKSLAVIFVLTIILINFFVQRIAFDPHKEEQALTKDRIKHIGHNPEIYGSEQYRKQCSKVFAIAVLTSWLGPLILCNHNLNKNSKKYFASIVCTYGVLMCGIISVNILHYFTLFEFNYHSAPITHCFSIKNPSEIINRYMLKDGDCFPANCESFYCKKVVRLCSENEYPYDALISTVLPICLALMFLGLLSSFRLFYFGNKENIYKLSEKMKRPIVHQLYLQDELRKRNKQKRSKDFILNLIDNAFKSDKDIFNKKDTFYGETCLHIAAKNRHFDELERMMSLGGDLYVRNNNEQNVYHYLNKYFKSRKDLIKLQEILDKTFEGNKQHVHAFKTKSKENELLPIGGKNNDEPQSSSIKRNLKEDAKGYEWLKKKIEEKLRKQPCLTSKEYDESLYCQINKVSSTIGLDSKEIQCLENFGEIEMSEGLSPLHLAAINDDLELMRIQIDKYKVNEKDSKGKTALHYATSHAHSLCVELLVQCNADILIKDEKGKTPLGVNFINVKHTNFWYKNSFWQLLLSTNN